MDIKDAYVKEISPQSGVTLEVTCRSLKDLDTSFSGCVIATMEDGTQFIFDMPSGERQKSQSFDLSPHIPAGETKIVEVAVDVYDINVIGYNFKNRCDVRITSGRAVLFSERYESSLSWRESLERLRVRI